MRTFDIFGIIKRETEKSYLIDEGYREIWIAKNQIQAESDRGVDENGLRAVELTIPEWLAKKESLI